MTSIPLVPPRMPGGKNWITNPSFETNTTGYTIPAIPGGYVFAGGVTFARTASDDAWAGDYVMRSQATTVVAMSPYSLYREEPVVAGDNCLFFCGYKLAGSNVQVYAAIEFFNAGNSTLGAYYDAQSGSGTPRLVTSDGSAWDHMTVSVVAPVGAVKARLYLFCHPTTTAPHTFETDAWDLRRNEAFDDYIDGDPRVWATFAWEGAAHASTSVRYESLTVRPTGHGGVVTVRSKVWQTDKQGYSRGAELTDYFSGGVIEYDIDREIKGSINFQTWNPDAFPRFSWIAVEQEVQYESGLIEAGPVGIFEIAPVGTAHGVGEVATINGLDPLVVLANSTMNDVHKLKPGESYIIKAREILNKRGLRHNLAENFALVPANGIGWKPGSSELCIVNDIMQAIGFLTTYTSFDGFVTSRAPIRFDAKVQPDHVYRVGDNADLFGSVVEDVNATNIYNNVVVVREDPASGAFLRASASLTTVGHPISIPTIGERSKVIRLNDAVDQATIQARAEYELRQAAVYVSLAIQVMPTPLHSPYESVLLDFSNKPGMSRLDGLYHVKGMSIPVGGTAPMTMRLRRIETYGI
jgi:hypothetical protein